MQNSTGIAESNHLNGMRNFRSSKMQRSLAVLFLAVVCVALGAWAVQANQKVYEHRAPVFDSMSYWERMHQVMSFAQAGQHSEALSRASMDHSTVTFPFLVSWLLSFMVEPSRSIGIWIQVGELTLLVLSVWYFFTRVRNTSPWFAAALAVPFILCRCYYRETGGLSDFRMDLSLFMMFGTACTWYLIASSTLSKRHFLLLGIIAGVACLFRAIAPVYLVMALIPVILCDLLLSQNRKKLATGLLLSLIGWSLSCLWFYIANFEYLYYYYFIWNTDAHAKLGFVESSQHIKFAFRHVGISALIYIACLYMLRRSGTGQAIFDGVFFKTIWIGAIPTMFLVVKGAGLNPFVCMPSVFGILMCMTVPLSRLNWTYPTQELKWRFAPIAIGCLIFAMWSGWKKHEQQVDSSMHAHIKIIELMHDDAIENSRDYVRFGASYEQMLNTTSLHNTLRFDYRNRRVEANAVYFGDILTSNDRTFVLPAVADWERVPGENDQQKITHLVHLANQNIDYIVIPDKSTSDQFESYTNAVVNLRSNQIQKRLLESNHWVAISGKIQITEKETVHLYRNQSRLLAFQKEQKHTSVAKTRDDSDLMKR